MDCNASGDSEPVSLPVVREKITELEKAIQNVPTECQVSFENLHNFCPGLYARTVFMPAGTVLTSKIHKTQHFFVVSKGSCTVVNSHGERELITAPYLGTTMPGTKRALLIHEDTIWTTFHATDLTDVAEIERTILAESFEAYDAEIKQ
jgi:hypothetical protein